MPDHPQAVFAIERPIPRLLAVYAVRALLMGPLFPVAIFPLYFRYHTMRYRFDDTGIVMSWGVLFHRETTIAYARIQDIHLTSNVVERWLGLARIQIQTASGSAHAEMVLEGLPDSGRIRDFLYARMRGVRTAPAAVAPPAAAGEAVGADSAAVAAALHETAQELRAVRELLAARLGTGGGDGR
ncbi:MAG TPA: PH domain-containing protein [Acidobacteriota bacterium]|nr:PH domain-containing protein [Acidobacteriota bacterium]HQM64569.1 PH domain-containing protein [Acidobacteriota bacterium]